MKLRLLALAILSVLLVAKTAQAEAVRLPASGDPAFVVDLPDGWMHRVDDGGNLILGAPDHSAAFSLSIFEYSGALDDAAVGVMKAAKAGPPQNTGPAEVSSYRGYIYDSAIVNDAGVKFNLHCLMVKLDTAHVASLSMITGADDSPEEYAAARVVLNGVTLTGK